ncbi:hypothetical protein PoB_001081500 [Plakobranchus ocellatus]|uniref:Uncharacterized protein n=1 Tax=Plakobranchus ocellatus TaxID=259542 RepID=A0AAV3YPB5_9GAST|nr:hypothetical protein PoB_001081500 [Plakobranchus ocellatus]
MTSRVPSSVGLRLRLHQAYYDFALVKFDDGEGVKSRQTRSCAIISQSNEFFFARTLRGGFKPLSCGVAHPCRARKPPNIGCGGVKNLRPLD